MRSGAAVAKPPADMNWEAGRQGEQCTAKEERRSGAAVADLLDDGMR